MKESEIIVCVFSLVLHWSLAIWMAWGPSTNWLLVIYCFICGLIFAPICLGLLEQIKGNVSQGEQDESV